MTALTCPHCGSKEVRPHPGMQNIEDGLPKWACVSCNQDFQMEVRQRRPNPIVQRLAYWFYGYPKAWFYTRVVVFHQIIFDMKELETLLKGVNPNRKQQTLEAELEKRGFNLNRPYLFQRMFESTQYEALQPHWRWRWCAKYLPQRILVDAIPENF